MVKTEDKQLPLIYLKLAKSLSGLGEHDLAQKVCDRGLVRFPNNTNLHCLRGGILVKLFNETKKQEHLSEALLSYEKSLSLNPDNYLSALTAAKIYIKSSALQKAREKLDKIFINSPKDVKATELLNTIKEKEKSIQRARGEKSQSLFEPLEETDDRTTSTSTDYDLLISHLYLFNRIKGIKMVLLSDMFGVILKYRNKSALDPNQLSIMISNIFRSSRNLIQRSSLGTFQQGVLVSPIGDIYTVAADAAILTIIAETDADHKLIENQIQLYLQETSP